MGVVQLNIILLQRVTGRPGPRWTRSTRYDLQLGGANTCVSQRANGAEERLETSLILTQQGMLYF
ncbi:hypothetical protein EV363DRAFT_1400114 [Boletus edulis]|nr:hypothetical protein EV363DRAFT_1400114 [Boletus edulis]